MEKYDYKKAMIEDIKNYIKDNPQQAADPFVTDDIEEYWYDILWAEDEITGNGAYWYDTEEKCSEYLSQNIYLLYDAIHEYCVDDDINNLIKQYENKSLARYFDCTIRCYLLSECLHQALEELNDG